MSEKIKEIEERKYQVTLTEKMLGTVPKNQQIYSTYIESKKPPEIKGPDEVSTVENLDEKGYTGFHQNENGLFVYDYLVKGFIKNAGNILKDIVGVKNLRSKLNDFLFVFPREISLGKTKPDGIFERPLRAQTPLGERIALTRSDYINAGTTFSFSVKLLPHSQLTWEIIDRLMQHGELMGFGQFRNGSFGRFTTKTIAIV